MVETNPSWCPVLRKVESSAMDGAVAVAGSSVDTDLQSSGSPVPVCLGKRTSEVSLHHFSRWDQLLRQVLVCALAQEDAVGVEAAARGRTGKAEVDKAVGFCLERSLMDAGQL
ncbi:uncharacterized protein LOC128569958 isoform X5 [Nycticebus coucang]|uniref:uncharacterized protein LOC128569958 isoform X5 n=1 Tax=Nycticebus coucang TaxID=9470 RepID=UPI00234C20CC|nr:uncharacterized protein LOC128569958 isoform X5 [Nycticebus coucang]